eukprot:CAMPEP_0181289018 /NCGR_PEP_ID=MMETSP1101-20121128/656_1 /TAXON_ID=46948 /ORGANISM="Rhodomonas abbreviata, Strain Caron Lab Isolate" /LENGTH=60 /DNA_ID=CAMNT_0023393207 /DNA_START=17 /DNA_END=199 /DNA_ORIENTATION=-
MFSFERLKPGSFLRKFEMANNEEKSDGMNVEVISPKNAGILRSVVEVDYFSAVGATLHAV